VSVVWTGWVEKPCILAVYCPAGALVTPFAGWTGDGTTFVARLSPDPEVFKAKNSNTASSSLMFACRQDALCVGAEPALMLDQDLNLGQTRRSEALGCDATVLPSYISHDLSDSNARYFNVAWVEVLEL